MDWTQSFYRHPWHVTNHCNVTFSEFLVREWGPGALADVQRPFCPKYEVLPSVVVGQLMG